MDVQQQIMLAIMKVFQEENVEFAYPAQTLYMETAFGDRSSENSPPSRALAY